MRRRIRAILADEHLSRLGRSGITYSAASGLGGVAGLLFVLVGARWEGEGAVTALTLALGIASAYTAIGGVGAAALTYRMAALDPIEGVRHWRTGSRYRVATSPGLVLLAALLFSLRDFDARTGILVALGAATNYATEPSVSLLTGRGRIRLVSGLGLAQKVLPLLLLLAPVGIGPAYLIGSTTTSVVALVLARRLVTDHGRVPMRVLFSQGWALGMVGVGDAIQGRGLALVLAIVGREALATTMAVPTSLTSGLGVMGYAAQYPTVALLGTERDLDPKGRRALRAVSAVTSVAIFMIALGTLGLYSLWVNDSFTIGQVLLLAAAPAISTLGSTQLVIQNIRLRFQLMIVTTISGAAAVIVFTLLASPFGVGALSASVAAAEAVRLVVGAAANRVSPASGGSAYAAAPNG